MEEQLHLQEDLALRIETTLVRMYAARDPPPNLPLILAVRSETGVQAEDVSRVGLTTAGTTEEGHLGVDDGLLGDIVVDDQHVLACI